MNTEIQKSKTINAVTFDKQRALTRNQKAGYTFIMDRVQSKQPITRDDVIEFYKDKILGERTCSTWHWKGEERVWTTIRMRDRSKYYTDPAAMQWFKTCIGQLVVRGVLVVIPVIDIQED